MAKSTPAGKKRVVVKMIARSAIQPAKCKGKSAKKQEAGSDKQEQMHAVEKILDHRYNIEGWLELLLEWKGTDPVTNKSYDSSWEPFNLVTHALLLDYGMEFHQNKIPGMHWSQETKSESYFEDSYMPVIKQKWKKMLEGDSLLEEPLKGFTKSVLLWTDLSRPYYHPHKTHFMKDSYLKRYVNDNSDVADE